MATKAGVTCTGFRHGTVGYLRLDSSSKRARRAALPTVTQSVTTDAQLSASRRAHLATLRGLRSWRGASRTPGEMGLESRRAAATPRRDPLLVRIRSHPPCEKPP